MVDQLRAVITYWHGLRAAGEASGARAFGCAAVEEKEGGELIAKSQRCNGATQQKVQPTATRGTRRAQARATCMRAAGRGYITSGTRPGSRDWSPTCSVPARGGERVEGVRARGAGGPAGRARARAATEQRVGHVVRCDLHRRAQRDHGDPYGTRGEGEDVQGLSGRRAKIAVILQQLL